MSELILRAVEPPGLGREIRVTGELVIGRDAAGDGCLNGEPALSRRHARIVGGTGGALSVEDLGSLNGTFVNDERIGAPRALRAGDTVRFGSTRLEVLDAATSARPGGPGPRRQTGDTVLLDRSDLPVAQSADRSKTGPGGSGVDLRLVLAGLAAVVLAVLAWLLLSGDEADPDALARAGRRSTVQLGLQPSGVVRSLRRAGARNLPPSRGAGIVVDARRGLVMTADRLIAGAAEITGRFDGGTARRATLVARAPCDGLALVRVRGLPDAVRAAAVAGAGGLERGKRIVALGFRGERAGRSRLRAVRGRVLAPPKSRTPSAADPRLSAVLLHSARIGSNGSGGPLLDGDGKVVALNLVLERGRGEALAIERARSLYRLLAARGGRRDLGWGLGPWSRIRPRTPGLLVTGVDPGGAAAGATLDARARARARRPKNPLLGATLFAVRGRSVTTVNDVCRALQGTAGGDVVRVLADVQSATLRGERPNRSRAVILRLRL